MAAPDYPHSDEWSELKEEGAAVLRERYGYLRAEILQRLDNRYKLLTALLGLAAAGSTAIFQFKWDVVALPVCAALLVLALILHGENRHIHLISNYLIMIERELDTYYHLNPKGWERFSRAGKGDKKLASGRLTAGALGFLILFYVAFGLVGARWTTGSLNREFHLSGWLVTALVFALIAVPLIAAVTVMGRDYRALWRTSTR